MITYIGFLRGINVGGQKKMPMAELRALLSKIGLQNVQTYIQSGNIIFQSDNKSAEDLSLNIHTSIRDHFGFEVPVLIKRPKELQQIFNDCPFSEEKKASSYFMLLYDVPDREMVNQVLKISYPNEEFNITNDCIYFYCATGYGKAKMSNNFFERKLKVTATARKSQNHGKVVIFVN